MKVKNYIVLLSLLLMAACSNALLKPDYKTFGEKAPEKFKVILHTTKGDVVLKIVRKYSPLAVDRFYYLVKSSYYNNNSFFRVVPNFVVQWGLTGNPQVNKIWNNAGIPDEPVKYSNKRGTIAFARDGKNTRSNQVYVNLKDNLRLDTTNFMGVKGFPAFGFVVKGMKVIDSIYAGYREEPVQDSIIAKGNDYLKRNFPKLDYIINAEVIE